MKVLFCTSEAYPFAMSGGLGDVSSALPAALRERVIGCRVVMPLYEDIKDEFREKMTFIKSITVPVSWRRQYCGIFEAKHNGVTYYLSATGFTAISTTPRDLRFSPGQFSKCFRSSVFIPILYIATIGRPPSCPHISAFSTIIIPVMKR